MLALALALAACDHGLCSRHSDCSPGHVCTAAGVCDTTPDASTDDANPAIDASVTAGDAENPVPDAPVTDGGP